MTLDFFAPWEEALDKIEKAIGRRVYFSWTDADETVVVDTPEEFEEVFIHLETDWALEMPQFNGEVDVEIVEVNRRRSIRGAGAAGGVAADDDAIDTVDKFLEEIGIRFLTNVKQQHTRKSSVCPLPVRGGDGGEVAEFDKLLLVLATGTELGQVRASESEHTRTASSPASGASLPTIMALLLDTLLQPAFDITARHVT